MDCLKKKGVQRKFLANLKMIAHAAKILKKYQNLVTDFG